MVAAAGRPVAVQQRHHPEGLRRQERQGLLPGAHRHRPLHVGSLDQGPGAEAGQEPQLLAEGKALPRQRHVDDRRRRQHAHPAAEGRPGAGRRVPALGLGGRPQEHPWCDHGPVPVHPHRLPVVQRAAQALPGRARAPGHRGTRVRWHSAAGTPLSGTTAGIDERGALLVQAGDRIERIVSGEVTWT